jgi:hypothetical protein
MLKHGLDLPMLAYWDKLKTSDLSLPAPRTGTPFGRDKNEVVIEDRMKRASARR